MGSFVDAGGLKTYYDEHGAGEPLVMLHGDILNAKMFSNQIPALAARYRIVLPERRGHGRTPDLPGDYTYPLFANDTIKFLDALGLERVNLLGQSGGANVALIVTLSRPDLVSKLVAISGETRIELTEQQKKDMRSWPAEDFRKRTPSVVDAYERVTPSGTKQFPQFFEKMKTLWTTDWSISEKELGSISAATLIMLGDHDFGSIEDAAATYRKIPGSQLCVVPGAGHGLMHQKPDLVNRIVLSFLDGERRI